MSEAPLILVVDDDPASCDIAARLLERQSYRTRRAGSGAECLRIVDLGRQLQTVERNLRTLRTRGAPPPSRR